MLAWRQTDLKRIHDAGLFAGQVPSGSRDYLLKVRWHGTQFVDVDDPYRFSPVLSDLDLHLMGEGNHLKIYDKLGAATLDRWSNGLPEVKEAL